MAAKKHKDKNPQPAQKNRQGPKSPVNEKVLLAFILGLTFFCMMPVLNNGFLNFDDPQYVTENPVIQKLDGENFKKLFTLPFVGNYQPVVMLSYAIQFKFFGTKAGGFHFFSLLMHLLNTALVFFLTKRLLKNAIAAAVTALLFGIHPLHVESVAWVASQKDVVYSFFFLSSSVFYLRYIEQPAKKKYFIFSMLLFVLSLLSKAQAVVLPVVFLLFDFLLKRKEPGAEKNAEHKMPPGKLVLEKLPFLALSLIFGLLAFYKQKEAGAVQDWGYFSTLDRVRLASYGFVSYLWQTVLPVKLSIFYPYPETDGKLNAGYVYFTPFIILSFFALVFALRKRFPVLVFGFLFFCVTIALVVQLIPVGDAIHADRYSYISLIGLFIFAGYIFSLVYEDKSKRIALMGISLIYFGMLALFSFKRARVFSDNITVYTDALENYPAPIIYSNRGAEWYKMNNYQAALNDFIAARGIKPRFPDIWFNSGMANQALGKIDDALHDYTEAVKYKPDDLRIYIQRAAIYKAQGKLNEAIADYSGMIRINPGVIDAWYGRGECYGRMNRIKEALEDYNKVIAMKPDYLEAYTNRGIVYTIAGNFAAALADYNHVISLKPDAWYTYFNRSLTFKAQGRYAEALQDAITAKNNGYPVNDAYLAELQKLSGK